MPENDTKAILLNEEATDSIQMTEIERESITEEIEVPAIKATPKAARVEKSMPPRREDINKFMESAPEAPKADELETLWPGVHHDLTHTVKRTPSFFIMLGFIGGAVVSLFAVWGYSFTSDQIAKANVHKDKPVLVAKANTEMAGTNKRAMTAKNVDPTAELVPVSQLYVVKSGDTLVSIALKNYRKVTPRLIDSIVENNNLKNADTLKLGQELSLPTYQPPARKLAAPSQAQIH